MDPGNIQLPEFLDPFLEWLSQKIPLPLYNLLLNVAAHSLAILTSVFNLVRLLASSSPSEWDAQTILPPLISLLAAYLAILSIYRTTSWMFRTGLFFAKWGTILVALAGGAGYLYGTQGQPGDGRAGGGLGRGIVGTLSRWALDAMNGQGQNAAGGRRHSQHAPRPRAWENWDAHREWQYEEDRYHDEDREDGSDVTETAKQVIGQILGFASRTVQEAGWWELIQGAVNGAEGGVEAEDASEGETRTAGRRKQPARKAKEKTKARGSRGTTR
jgi:hypothetical protein